MDPPSIQKALAEYVAHPNLQEFLVKWSCCLSAQKTVDGSAISSSSSTLNAGRVTLVSDLLTHALSLGDRHREIATYLVSTLEFRGCFLTHELALSVAQCCSHVGPGGRERDALTTIVASLIIDDALCEEDGALRSDPASAELMVCVCAALNDEHRPIFLEQLRTMFRELVADYFDGGCFGDLAHLAASARGLNMQHAVSELVRKIVQRCVEHPSPDILEAGSCLLVLLCERDGGREEVLRPTDVFDGFLKTLRSLDSLVLDAPLAPSVCAGFIARAVLDGLLDPTLLNDAALPSWVAAPSPIVPSPARQRSAERSSEGEWHAVLTSPTKAALPPSASASARWAVIAQARSLVAAGAQPAVIWSYSGPPLLPLMRRSCAPDVAIHPSLLPPIAHAMLAYSCLGVRQDAAGRPIAIDASAAAEALSRLASQGVSTDAVVSGLRRAMRRMQRCFDEVDDDEEEGGAAAAGLRAVAESVALLLGDLESRGGLTRHCIRHRIFDGSTSASAFEEMDLGELALGASPPPLECQPAAAVAAASRSSVASSGGGRASASSPHSAHGRASGDGAAARARSQRRRSTRCSSVMSMMLLEGAALEEEPAEEQSFCAAVRAAFWSRAGAAARGRGSLASSPA